MCFIDWNAVMTCCTVAGLGRLQYQYQHWNFTWSGVPGSTGILSPLIRHLCELFCLDPCKSLQFAPQNSSWTQAYQFHNANQMFTLPSTDVCFSKLEKLFSNSNVINQVHPKQMSCVPEVIRLVTTETSITLRLVHKIKVIVKSCLTCFVCVHYNMSR